MVSLVINKVFAKNFSEFINAYRIKEAQALLKDKSYAHIKISNVAYDSGFNSLSSFNIAFKKVTGNDTIGF